MPRWSRGTVCIRGRADPVHQAHGDLHPAPLRIGCHAPEKLAPSKMLTVLFAAALPLSVEHVVGDVVLRRPAIGGEGHDA